MDQITEIAVLVGKVYRETEQSITTTRNVSLRDEADSIVRRLAECETRLREDGEDGRMILAKARSKRKEDQIWKQEFKDFLQTIPRVVFEIARQTKELVARVDTVEDEGDDFR